MIDISVIVPNYNGGGYLEKCLRSILLSLNMFGGSAEVLVVDDASTDNSLDIVNGLSDPRVKLVSLIVNGGQAAARNRGLELAQGEYISFVDSDDYVSEEYYCRMISGGGSDLVICDFIAVDSEGRELSYEENDISEMGLVSSLMSAKLSAVVWDKIYSKKIISEYGLDFFEGVDNEDILFNLAYMNKCSTFEVVKEGLIFYRQHESSVTKQFSISNILDMNLVWREVLKMEVGLANEKSFFTYYVCVIGFKRILSMSNAVGGLKSLCVLMRIVRCNREFVSISLRDSLKQKIILCFLYLLSLSVL